jgi:triosephosphate isomerase
MRRPILAANWKMQKTVGEAEAFAAAFRPLVAGADSVDIVLAPPATALHALGKALAGSNVALSSQNVNPNEKGAFTGELSPDMIADVGCHYAIVGHSERRTLYGESSEFVAQKAAAVLAKGIRPIVCVGESDDEREAGQTFAVIGDQLQVSLAEVPRDRGTEIVVAYEPIWAIGTGKTATPAMAQEVHAMIRERLRDMFGSDGDQIRIQYGGSVKPDNVTELMAQADIDGALVGGASLEPDSFSKIVNFNGEPA